MIWGGSGNWRWHFVSSDLREKFGSRPEEALFSARLVHQVRESRFEREVWFCDGFYCKLESHRSDTRLHRLTTRFRSRIQSEFKSLHFLRKCGIAAVEPAAYGTCGCSAMLITREEPKMTTVREYLLRRLDTGTPIPNEFLDGWCGVLQNLYRQSIYFPDFHCGNLLCDAAGKRFVVVDPLGARRIRINRESHFLRMMRRQFGIALEYLPYAAILRIMSAFAPNAPEELYLSLLKFSAKYVNRRYMRDQKRLKRFRSGAHTATANGVEYKFSNEERLFKLDDTEKLLLPPAAAQELWERDYILSLHRIPLLRIVARTADGKILFRQRGTSEAAPDERPRLDERLRLAGFAPEDFDLVADRHGRTMLADMKFQRG